MVLRYRLISRRWASTLPWLIKSLRLETPGDGYVVGSRTVPYSDRSLEFTFWPSTHSILSTQRYESATLHTTRVFSGLPYYPFPKDYPLYVPAHLIAKHYYDYAKKLRLPAYCGREASRASWDEGKKLWTVEVKGPNGVETTSAKHLVFAVGIGGRLPKIPDFPGRVSWYRSLSKVWEDGLPRLNSSNKFFYDRLAEQDIFRGEQIHSASYTNAKSWKGKKVVVIGAATTACDVALDCARQGIEVTMVQRGPTRIYPDTHIANVQLQFWNDQQPVEIGDIMTSEDPMALQAPLNAKLLGSYKEQHE